MNEILLKFHSTMNSIISKVWQDVDGNELLQFPAYINLNESEIKLYLIQEREPILIKQYFDVSLVPQVMISNFAKSPKSDQWRQQVDPAHIIYQKYTTPSFDLYPCCIHNAISNCQIICEQCNKQYECIQCAACECFKLKDVIKCKKCGHEQDINNKICEGCHLQLYDYLCKQCGPMIRLNGQKIIHCNKCQRCHDTEHQYCKICNRCDNKELFIELHEHRPKDIVCCICNQIKNFEAMRFKTLKCNCSCCFTCMTLGEQRCLKHNNSFGQLEPGSIWGGL